MQKPPANFAANTVYKPVIEPVISSLGVSKGDDLTAKPPVKTEPSEEGYRFADWFCGTLPERVRDNLVASWRDKWAECYDEMIRLDGATRESVFAACEWARKDGFWSTNFYSPLKLRARNKDKIKYIDLFLEQSKGRNGRRQTVPSMVQSGKLTEDNAL